LLFSVYIQQCVSTNIIQVPKFVRTPGGAWAWSECVHEVPDGSHIFDDSDPGTKVVLPDGTIRMIPECTVKYNGEHHASHNATKSSVSPDGWQVWSSFKNPDNSSFTSFVGNFNVPAAPTKWAALDNAILYMFTGLQNVDWIPAPPRPPAPPGFDIIQPVLQYGGGSAGGGGKYWAVASWYVTLDDSFVLSSLKKVETGDSIFGNMTQTAKDTWFIGSKVASSGVTTNLVVTKPRLVTQPWAYCTLEVYDVSSCEWFPTNSPLKFTDMALASTKGAVTAKWVTHEGDNPCKATITVNSPEAVTIDF